MFSIIIPLYNKGSLVKRALDTVLSQTCQDFEIVVVDDGSGDDSASYVIEYSDSRIKYYFKENEGVSSARNYGVDKAKGDWIIFLDADDEMLPGTLSAYKKQIEKFPNTKMHVTRQDNDYEGHGILQKINQSLLGDSRETKSPFFAHWFRLFFPCPGTVCILKNLIAERGGFDSRISFYEDIEFMIRMMHGNCISYSTHLALKYNQDGSGLSGSFHPIEKEMAYYIPKQVRTASFWHKALLYENIEMEILWWQQQGNEEYVKFYQDMQKQCFSWIFKALHWIRQKMIRNAIL